MKAGPGKKRKRLREKTGLRGMVNDPTVERYLRDNARADLNFPTEETEKKGSYIERLTKEGKRRAYNTLSTNLDYYHGKGLISWDQRAAGVRFYGDFYASRLIGGLKSCLNVSLAGRTGTAGLNFQAYESYIAARDAISGKRPQKLLIAVCCHGEWLKDVNNAGILPHKRMDAFQRALDELARHYESRINPKKVMRSFNESMERLT